MFYLFTCFDKFSFSTVFFFGGGFKCQATGFKWERQEPWNALISQASRLSHLRYVWNQEGKKSYGWLNLIFWKLLFCLRYWHLEIFLKFWIKRRALQRNNRQSFTKLLIWGIVGTILVQDSSGPVWTCFGLFAYLESFSSQSQHLIYQFIQVKF